MSSLQKEIYKALKEPDNLRLLELLPDKSGRSIKCRLRTARLAERPLYTAISYTWGDESTCHSITVNDGVILVRENLHSLLQDLRHSRDPQILWIDALCINQADNAERSQQVRLRGDVYRSASGVVAWLKDARVGNGHISDGLTNTSSGGEAPEKNVLLAFFGHEYWSRRWIIQEIALASSASISCGRKTVPFAYIKRLKESLDFYGRHELRCEGRGLQRLQESQTISRLTLEKLMSEYRESECKEALDKVFALVSLSQAATRCFSLSYAMSRGDLMMTVLYFSSVYEDLDPMDTVGYAVFLSYQLGITSKHREAYEGPITWIAGSSSSDRPEAGIESVPVVLGHVNLSAIPAELRGTVENWRKGLHGLQEACGGRLVASHFFSHGQSMLSFANISNHGTEPKLICPIDLCAFGWESSANMRTHPNFRSGQEKWIGFATAEVELHDKILQFPGTSVAIIVRQRDPSNPPQYDVVARARLATKESRSDEALEELYYPPRRPSAETWSVWTEGWHTLGLIRLASDNHERVDSHAGRYWTSALGPRRVTGERGYD
jgi:hypothetical protein